jgi:mannitol/fructose-specific phosphotransferase system IIA component (Ntr-type)
MSAPFTADTLAAAVQRGIVRVPYAMADFASAVRGLLEPPLLASGVSADRLDEIVDGVLKREQTGSTCAGPIALPHARTGGISTIVAGLGINPGGVYPGGSTRVMLAFVTPQDAAAEHLRFLSSAAKTFRDSAFLDRLLNAATSDDVLALLTDPG